MTAITSETFLDNLLKRLVERHQLPQGLKSPKFKEEFGSIRYCKIADADPFQIFFYCGPYFKKNSIWVGFGSPHGDDFISIRSAHPAASVLKNGAWTDEGNFVANARAKAKNHRYVYEDLTGTYAWKWFGVYMLADDENVERAADVIGELQGLRSSEKRNDRPEWIGATEKDAVRKIRLAQEYFRQRQLAKWGRRCCVTGCGVEEILRASHIDGWAANPKAEDRTSETNGLLLISTLDALFDRHLISFKDDGTIPISAEIFDQKVPGLSADFKIPRGLDAQQIPRMKRHRARFEKKQARYLAR